MKHDTGQTAMSNVQLQTQLIPTYDVSCKGTADRFGFVTCTTLRTHTDLQVGQPNRSTYPVTTHT